MAPMSNLGATKMAVFILARPAEIESAIFCLEDKYVIRYTMGVYGGDSRA